MTLLRRTRRTAAAIPGLLAFVAVATLVLGIEPQNTHAQQPGSNAATSTVPVNQAAPPPNQPASITQADQAKTLRRVFVERLIDPVTWFTGLLLLVGLLQWRVMGRQADVAEKQNDILVRQERIMDGQRRTTDLMLASNQEIERAYISISHKDVSVTFQTVPDGDGGYVETEPLSLIFTVHVRNSGRTPGNLIGGYFGFRIAPTPGTPDVTRAISPLTAAFLNPDDHVEFGLTVMVSDNEDLRDVLMGTGENRLWLIGEVDYSDRFGQRHTGGYGRCLRQQERRYGFSFVSDTGPFNYDRPMTLEKEKHYGPQI